MDNNEFDVLIIGGYSLTEVCGGGPETRDKIRLSYKNFPATVDFIKSLVQSNGNLDLAQKKFLQINRSKFTARSLNTIYLVDFLSKNNIRSKVVNYFVLEQNKFRELLSFKPKVIALSTTFISEARDINNIAKTVRELSPQSIIIAGGIKILKSFKSFSLYKQKYFDGFDIESLRKSDFFFDYENDKYIDVFVIEENGELTLLDLIRKIKNNQNYKSTPNIAYREKEKLICTERIPEPYTFEKNLISWDKIPTDIIGLEIPVRAGMGCPYKCAFCDFTGLHKVKLRTIDSLIEELKLIQKSFPEKPVFFTDDNLFTSKKRTKDLAEVIVKSNLHFKWRAFFRVDAISEDNVEILAKSGCAMAYLGVESGDENILKNMNKKATREQILKAVTLLSNNGINSISTIIIGFPGETKESVDKTTSLLNSYPTVQGVMNQYYPFVFIFFPLSPIASPENRIKYGLKGGYETWSHTTMNSDQAKEHLIRLFKEVDGPILPYPEFIGPDIGIPFSKIMEIFKARERIVKDGTNLIDQNNVLKIVDTFKKIIS